MSQRATVSRKQTNTTDYDIRTYILALVGCLAQRKRTINRRVKKRLDIEQFRHFGAVYVKEDREAGKLVQKPPCLFTRQSRSVQLDSRSVCETSSRAIKSRTRAAKSRDKIAGVTSV